MARGITTTILLLTIFVLTLATRVGLAAGAADPLVWHTDYGTAMEAAKQADRMLLVYFRADHIKDADDQLAKRLETETNLRPLVDRFVLVRLPFSAQVKIGGEEVQLINHAAFVELGNEPGLAIIDLGDRDSKYYGCVVSVYPFSIPRALDSENLAALLNLPRGSLTQRSLILAVRMHPERPASANGQLLADLAEETARHSQYQAEVRHQGHHRWESRFHRINRLLPGGLLSQEVCAESWPGQRLMHAAIECVDSWRQSAGHWRAVRGHHSFFGYDMKRGGNGIWYATGIFSLGR